MLSSPPGRVCKLHISLNWPQETLETKLSCLNSPLETRIHLSQVSNMKFNLELDDNLNLNVVLLSSKLDSDSDQIIIMVISDDILEHRHKPSCICKLLR